MHDELKRLKRFIVCIFMLLLLVVTAIAFWGASQLRETNRLIAVTKASVSKPVQGLDGLDGLQGMQGIQGQPGRDGKDSQSTTTIVEKPTIIQQPLPYPVQGEKGERGDQGEPGIPGRELQIGKQQGEIVFKYTGDSIWQAVEEILP